MLRVTFPSVVDDFHALQRMVSSLPLFFYGFAFLYFFLRLILNWPSLKKQQQRIHAPTCDSNSQMSIHGCRSIDTLASNNNNEVCRLPSCTCNRKKKEEKATDTTKLIFFFGCCSFGRSFSSSLIQSFSTSTPKKKNLLTVLNNPTDYPSVR